MGGTMEHLNYVFFEEYKRLNKLCGELYNDPAGVTCYIDHMKHITRKEYHSIPNWQTDLEHLIRFRHIRNNLAHTEGAFKEKSCTQNDINWIRNFYNRIMNQTDPIAMLHRNSISGQIPYPINQRTNHLADRQMKSQTGEENKAFYWIVTVFVIAAILFLSMIPVVLFGMSKFL